MEEFTVSQMVAVTGLRNDSVRTEVQRMKTQGYLTVASEGGTEGRPAGRPRCIYRLSGDAEKRLELAHSVSAFYLATDSQPTEPYRPQGRHYAQAMGMIQDLEAVPPEDALRRSEMEEQAAYHLDYAAHEEAARRPGKEITSAYLDRARARLEASRGDIAQAEALFQRSLDTFQEAGLGEEVQDTRDWLLAVRLKYQLADARQAGSQELAIVIERSICGAITPGSHPLLLLLRDIRDVLAAVVRSPSEQLSMDVLAATERMLTVEARLTKSAEKLERATVQLSELETKRLPGGFVPPRQSMQEPRGTVREEELLFVGQKRRPGN
jgi:tetratricopeptide (TPR) repeat protein